MPIPDFFLLGILDVLMAGRDWFAETQEEWARRMFPNKALCEELEARWRRQVRLSGRRTKPHYARRRGLWWVTNPDGSTACVGTSIRLVATEAGRAALEAVDGGAVQLGAV
jgi:hypothetical protein